MELAQYQLQIFVSLVVILGAAFVALIVDFLKGSNEQLRELAIELRVRREEEQRRSHMLTPRQVAPAPAAQAEKRAEAPSSAARSLATPPVERKRTPSPDALAAMERGARMAASPRASRPAAPPPAPEPVVEVAPKPEIIPAPAPTAAKKDWEALLTRRGARARQAAPAVENLGHVPAGFHEGFVLRQLVQNRQPVSGLVVSIGVNAERDADGTVPQPVMELVQSLIGPGDFACQTNAEEFLLIYPAERGAAAQRRLSHIAQQLWDFQLRSLGAFQILFSWGGVEVHSEAIDEAIASANERMQETRRGRKLLTMEPRHELRKAV